VPELPEVETTRRGLEPHLAGQRIKNLVVRERRLRWPVARGLEAKVAGTTIRDIGRRGKYLTIDTGHGWLIIHLGMSGSLRVVPSRTPPARHDHFDIVLSTGMSARFTDARRFGALLWTTQSPLQHELLRHLAPEPLESGFDAKWLHSHTRGRTAAIKLIVMNNAIVTGVGNIYANEALFRAGINPKVMARRLSLKRCESLVAAIKQTLHDAIAAGGSTLRDFFGADGSRGYFQQQYMVYGRQGSPCRVCSAPIRITRLGQRSTFYCPKCQS